MMKKKRETFQSHLSSLSLSSFKKLLFFMLKLLQNDIVDALELQLQAAACVAFADEWLASLYFLGGYFSLLHAERFPQSRELQTLAHNREAHGIRRAAKKRKLFLLKISQKKFSTYLREFVVCRCRGGRWQSSIMSKGRGSVDYFLPLWVAASWKMKSSKKSRAEIEKK